MHQACAGMTEEKRWYSSVGRTEQGRYTATPPQLDTWWEPKSSEFSITYKRVTMRRANWYVIVLLIQEVKIFHLQDLHMLSYPGAPDVKVCCPKFGLQT